jgi:uncharacterized OsmC-like protein
MSQSSSNLNISNGVNAQVLGKVVETIKQQAETAKVTFKVQTTWSGGDGFKITSTGRDFLMGGQTVVRENPFTLVSDFPVEMGGKNNGPTVCEMCMAAVGSCVSQTIIAFATMMGIQLDKIRVETEGDFDIRGMTSVSDKVRPGAQEFRLNFFLESKTASKEQLERLYELGKKFSPAMDTLTHGTAIKTALRT